MKRIKAFTILELIMAMMISTAVISIGYYAFLFLGRQFSAYSQKSTNINEYILLKKALSVDFEHADLIVASGEAEVLLSDFRRAKEIRYNFYDNLILRSQENYSDTFLLRHNQLLFRMVSDSSFLINSIDLNILIDQKGTGLTFKKEYTARQLMSASNHLNE